MIARIALLLTSSCILPPPVGVETVTNTAPVIDYDTTTPSAAAVTLNTNCTRCPFTINAIDPDNEQLFMRGFVDIENRPTQVACTGFAPPPTGGAGREPLVCNLLPFLLAMDPGDRNRGLPLEVWIADRDFTGVSGHILPSGALYTVGRWTITFERRGAACDDLERIGCTRSQ